MVEVELYWWDVGVLNRDYYLLLIKFLSSPSSIRKIELMIIWSWFALLLLTNNRYLWIIFLSHKMWEIMFSCASLSGWKEIMCWELWWLQNNHIQPIIILLIRFNIFIVIKKKVIKFISWKNKKFMCLWKKDSICLIPVN